MQRPPQTEARGRKAEQVRLSDALPGGLTAPSRPAPVSAGQSLPSGFWREGYVTSGVGVFEGTSDPVF